MSVNPLDLQVNLGNMNKVGKQQVLAKEQGVLRQDQASEHLQKTGEKDAVDVPETKKLADESGKVKNEKEKNNNNQAGSEEKQDGELSDENGEKAKKKHIKAKNVDPDIGQSIDIVG